MSDNNGGGRFVGFLAFLVTMLAATLYLVSMVLSFFDIPDFPWFETLQSVASVIMIVIVSITGWRYVKTKAIAWKLVYVFVLLTVVASVVVPIALKIVAAQQA